jgi:hypothetical protein
MSITAPREPYKINGAFEYPFYYEKFDKAISSVWRPQEVSLAQDVHDWHECSKEEKDVIAGILRGFTQLELHVGCYWGDVITKTFPKHEVVAMARAFSCSEAVHAAAYSYLSDELGLDEFGDIVIEADELAIIRGGWEDRNGNFYEHVPVDNTLCSLNIFFKESIQDNLYNRTQQTRFDNLKRTPGTTVATGRIGAGSATTPKTLAG